MRLKQPSFNFTASLSLAFLGLWLAFKPAFGADPSLPPQNQSQPVESNKPLFNAPGQFINQSQIKEMSGRILLDAFTEATRGVQSDRYIEVVNASTPSTPATNHSRWFFNGTAKQLCAIFDNGAVGCLGAGVASTTTLMNVTGSNGINVTTTGGTANVSISSIPFAISLTTATIGTLPYAVSLTTAVIGTLPYSVSLSTGVMGTLSNSSIDSSSITKQGNTFNGASQLVQLSTGANLSASFGVSASTFRAGNGSQSLPAYSFTSRPDTGMYFLNDSSRTVVYVSSGYIVGTFIGDHWDTSTAGHNNASNRPFVTFGPGIFPSTWTQAGEGLNVWGNTDGAGGQPQIDVLASNLGKGDARLIAQASLADTPKTVLGYLAAYGSGHNTDTYYSNGPIQQQSVAVIFQAPAANMFEMTTASQTYFWNANATNAAYHFQHGANPTGDDIFFLNGSGTFTSTFTVTTASVSINNVPYKFPSSQGSASTFLKNDGTGQLSWGSGSGGIVQVVFSSVTVSSATTVSSFVKTNLAATITPTSSSNHIFIFFSGTLQNGTAGNTADLTIERNGSNLYGSNGGCINWTASTTAFEAGCSMQYWDNPATTSATTYQIYIKSNGVATATLGDSSTTQTLIVAEVAL